MSVVWPAICALAALAAGVQQTQTAGDAPQMRTKSHSHVRQAAE